jgi:acyl-CoA thioester hydrolase
VSKIGITYRGVVQQWHCDFMGHMNVMWYVGKFDEGTWNLAVQCGLTASYLRDSRRGMAAVDQHISYRKELLVGDVIVVRSALLEVKPKAVRFVHEMFRADTNELAAVMMIKGVHIDTAARKSVAFEPHILAKSQDLLEPNPERWDVWPPTEAHLK